MTHNSITDSGANAAAFKTRDAESYDALAGDFERFAKMYSPPLVTRMLTHARLSRTTRVLDIGAGTGIVALAAAATSAHVTAIDLSLGMLARAKENAEQAGVADRIDFRLMDAEVLTLNDRSFDCVLSLFALHHFPDPARALKEMQRVLVPGGTLVVGSGSPPSRFTLAGVVDAAGQVRDRIKEKRGLLLKAPRFMNEFVAEHFPDSASPELTALAETGWRNVRTVRQLVRDAGFVNVQIDWVGLRRVVGSAEEFWDLQRVYSSKARKKLSNLTEKQLANAREQFLAHCNEVKARGGEFVYSYAAQFVIANSTQAGASA